MGDPTDTKYNGDKVTLREFDNKWEDHCRMHEQWREDHMRAHELERDRVQALVNALGIRVDHTNEWRAEELEDRHLFVRQDLYNKDVGFLLAAQAENRGERRVLLFMLSVIGLLAGAGAAAAIERFT